MTVLQRSKLVRSLEVAYARAIRAEEQSPTVQVAWARAAVAETLFRKLTIVRSGGELPIARTKRNVARGALAALAAFGRAVARAMQAKAALAKAQVVNVARRAARIVRRSLRSAVGSIVNFIVSNKEGHMFKVGQMVRSRVNAQGMVKGEAYEVRYVAHRRTFTGTFTTYGLTGRSHAVADVELDNVGNGHLVLEMA